jgi:hypothetical protein
VRLVSPIGGAPGGSGNLSTSLSNVTKAGGTSKIVWVFNANYDGTIFYNNPVFAVSLTMTRCRINHFLTFDLS